MIIVSWLYVLQYQTEDATTGYFTDMLQIRTTPDRTAVGKSKTLVLFAFQTPSFSSPSKFLNKYATLEDMIDSLRMLVWVITW